jgi:hypothetical protein
LDATSDRLTDESDIVARVKEEKRKFEARYSAWKKEARENYDMVAGDGRQWDKEDREKLKEQDRPCVEFNRLGTIIDAVSGSEINNRQEATYIPRVPGNVQAQALGELRTAAAKWARDNCDAEDEESDAFVDVLVSGVGCTQTRMDYEGDEEGQILIERKDPLRLGWDASAIKRNLADRKCQWEECRFTRAEVEARWPDRATEISFSQDIEDDTEDELHVTDPKTSYEGNEGGQGLSGMVDVTHFQWYDTITVYKVAGAQGVVEMDEDRFKVLEQAAVASGQQPPQHAKTPRRVFMEAFICGNVELETAPVCEKASTPAKDFTFQFITGKRDRNRGYWYGLVRPGKDPQRWANKFVSQLLHIINTNAKGGLMMETGAAANQKKFEENWAKSDSISWLNPGGLGKVQPKQAFNPPQSLFMLMDQAISAIPDSTGVNLELLGLVDRNQAGVLEQQRTQAGLTILAPFFSNMRLYRKRQGRLLLYFIKEYISDGRLIRVVGQDGVQFLPLLRDPIDVDYETVVDESPTSRDTKEKTWAALMPIIGMMQQQGIMPPPEVLDYMPIPASLAQKIKQAVLQHQQQQQQDQSGKRMQNAQVWKEEADAEQKESAAAKNYLEAGLAGVQLFQAVNGQGVPGTPQPGMPQQPQQPQQPGMQPSLQ